MEEIVLSIFFLSTWILHCKGTESVCPQRIVINCCSAKSIFGPNYDDLTLSSSVEGRNDMTIDSAPVRQTFLHPWIYIMA